FSQYIKKNEHKHEMFVFIGAEGGIVQYITGCDMELYGLLTSCAELHESDEFVETTSHSPSDDVRH
ncbi:MAG: hypothetical protein ACXWVU_05440, partial [Sulfuricurvum sp.]